MYLSRTDEVCSKCNKTFTLGIVCPECSIIYKQRAKYLNALTEIDIYFTTIRQDFVILGKIEKIIKEVFEDEKLDVNIPAPPV